MIGWKGAADIKDVTFRIITDPNTMDIALESGDLDFAELSATSVNTAKENDGLNLVQVSDGSVTYVIMNTTVAPFDNKLFRQAINYAVDREFMVEAATEGIATPNSLMLPLQCSVILRILSFTIMIRRKQKSSWLSLE